MKVRRVNATFLCVFLIFILVISVNGTAWNSFFSQASPISCETAKVILEAGTAGTSTIYVNSTSSKVSVKALNWLSGWDKRIKITVNSSYIDETLIDFPILLYLSNSSSGENDKDVSCIFDEIGSDRKKIAVTTSDSGTQCYVEIEKWDAANEKAWLWVKVPSISNLTDTELCLYYDKDHADNTNYVGDTGSTAAQNVWDSSFKGVWHLSETSGGTGAIKDSTLNNNAGTDYGNPTFNATGSINSAISFDGIDDFINITNSASLQLTTSLTIEAWVTLNSFGSGYDVDTIVRKGEANPNDYQLAVHDQKLELMIEENDDGGLHGSTTLSSTTWYYLVGSWDGSTRNVYLNGSVDGSSSKTESITPDTRAIYIGGRAGTDLSAGVIDEVRVSNKSRSAAWIKATYKSETDNLVDFGSEETNTIDYVDNNSSDVGYPNDIGTHSNFTAQQYGPDSFYDILTEEDTATGSITYENSAESYSAAGQSSHSFNYFLQKSSGNERLVVITVSWEDAQASASILSLTFSGVAMTKIADVTVGTGYSEYISLWYLLDSSLPSSSGSYNIALTVSETITREIYMAVVEYSGVKQSAPDDYDTHANTVSGNTAITLTAVANGSLVVAGVGEGGTNPLTNTNNINNLQEQLLTSSGSALGHHTNVASGNITIGWNNLNTREGMVGAVWQPTNTNYELDLEVQWTNVNYTQSNAKLCIKTGTASAEQVKVDVWNGSQWINILADLTPNSWNNVSVSSYLTTSNFTIRFKGGNEINDRTQDSWNIDATLLHIWTGESYNYVLKVVNQVSSSWTINLKLYNSSDIGRLSTLTISLYDGTSSTQIAISDGSIIRSEGESCNLPEGLGSTVFININNLLTTTSGTSYLYVYLKILVPSTSTYNLFSIVFEVT